ncbi:MAG: DUF4102 domain-containing protein [Candidimonas sp.]|nr:MAG: DUF4102 domain-containing protein [Candidimonas sp.]
MSLKPNEIAAFQPSLAPYKKTDGKGLYLHVMPSGARYWRFRYRWAGKQTAVSCGVYPQVGLEEARQRRDAFRQMLADGANPADHTRAERAAEIDAQARQRVATRFTLDSTGALAVRLDRRAFTLSASETQELRAFLDATRGVGA